MILRPVQSLRDLTVLIADNDGFRGDYIAQVLSDAGATIDGPHRDLTAGLVLDQTRSFAATLAYVGCTVAVEAQHALMMALFTRGVANIAVCTTGCGTRAHPNILALPAPFAAFQVVEALVELISRSTLAGTDVRD